MSAVVLLFAGLLLAGCRCPCRNCGAGVSSEGRPAPDRRGGPVNTVRPNVSAVEFEVEGVEKTGEDRYLVRGRVLSARPAGSGESLAEAGQLLTLAVETDAVGDSSGGPDRAFATVVGARKGQKVRCDITLGADGTWKIVSVH